MTRLSLLDVGVARPVVEELVEEARVELGEFASGGGCSSLRSGLGLVRVALHVR